MRLKQQYVSKIGYRISSLFTPPEQSIYSFKLAYEKGYRVFLVDLQITKDGQIVCWHDIDLKRGAARTKDGKKLKNHMWVSESNLENINYICDFGILKGKKYKNLKILLFEQFLRFCHELDVQIILETKCELNEINIERIISLLDKYSMNSRIYWAEDISRIESVKIVRKYLPNARIIVRRANRYNYEDARKIIFDMKKEIEDLTLTIIDSYIITNTNLIQELKKNNIKIFYSEIHSRIEIFLFKKIGVWDDLDLVSSKCMLERNILESKNKNIYRFLLRLYSLPKERLKRIMIYLKRHYI